MKLKYVLWIAVFVPLPRWLMRTLTLRWPSVPTPDCTGTDLNFDGLSGENYDVFRDSELSRIPNSVPIFCYFECNVTSHVDKVYTCKPNTYIEFVVVRFVLSSSKCSKYIFGRVSTPDTAGVGVGAYDASQSPNRPGRKIPPYSSRGYLRCLDLGALGASNSVQIFCRRFVVTLVNPPWVHL